MALTNGLDHQAADRAQPPDVAASSEDLTAWYSQMETCELLGWAKRTLNEKLQAGDGPEKRMRRVPGRKDEPCYRREDVDHLAAKKLPAPVVFSPNSGIGPREAEITNYAGPAEVALIVGEQFANWLGQFSGQVLERIERLQPVDRGPWLTIPDAAKHAGLTERALHRVWRRLKTQASSEVILDGGRKIRRAAVDGLDAAALNNPADRAADRAMGRIAAARSAIAGSR